VAPERGETLVLPLGSDISTFNPYQNMSADAAMLHDLLFPRLLEPQPDYTAGPPSHKPALATSWTLAPDGLSARFALREAAWSDGTPITAEDVRFTWEAARSPEVAWPQASIVDFLADVEVRGPRDLTVRFTQAYPYALLDVEEIKVLPRHVFGKVPFAQWRRHGAWDAEAKVSGGPWMLTERAPNESITFVRNPRWWGSGPYLERVVFRVHANQETMLSLLRTGEIDALGSVPPKDLPQIREHKDLLLYSFQSRTIAMIAWNCGRPPFDDARVRRAMTLAIDRENLVESLLFGQGTVAGPMVITSLWASNRAVVPWPHDPGAAEALLDAAGWKREGTAVRSKDGKPLAFTLSTNAGNDQRKRIVERVQADLARIGVTVEAAFRDFNQLGEQMRRHALDAFLGGLQASTKVDGKPMFHSASRDGGFNYADYVNPELDRIIDAARAKTDLAEAKPLWMEMQAILHQEQPYTPLYEPRGLTAVSARIRNVRVTSLSPYGNLHEWWVPKGEQRRP
jgi:peptide/nickel transport system substrate-binding protein